MGWGKKADSAPAAQTAKPEGVIASGELLNTEDLRNALDIVLNLGEAPAPSQKGEGGVYKVFELPFYCKKVFWDEWLSKEQNEHVQAFMNSEAYKRASASIVKALDMNGDGRLTPRDFQIMYDTSLNKTIQDHEDVINYWLPFVGQCVFGLAVGYGIGALTRSFYRQRFVIAGFGLAGYSLIEYASQENYVNRRILEEAFKAKVKQLADINGDGEINREDINALVRNRMQYIATKLGPGGLAPGLTGYASVLLGFARGARFI